MKWRCCHHVEVSHTTVNKQHDISHLSLVPLNKLHNAPQSDTHKAEEQFDACRSCFWCVGSRCPVDGESGPVWKSSPAGARDLDLGQVTTFDLLVRNSDKTNSSNGTNRDLSTSIPVSLSAVAGGVKPAQPAIRLFQSGLFFFLLKRHSTRSPRITAYDSLCGNFFTLTNWAAKAPPDLSITPIVKNSGLKLRLGDLNFATQASSFKATF